MCFLLCYASMNLNCFVLDILKDPHWRPRWRWFHWSCGLLGFLLCATLMFIIAWYFALAAWALALAILGLIVRSSAQTDWGSALHGLRFQVATKSLLAIDMEQHLDSNWQPQMLLLYQVREDNEAPSANPEPKSPLARASDGGDKGADQGEVAAVYELLGTGDGVETPPDMSGEETAG